MFSHSCEYPRRHSNRQAATSRSKGSTQYQPLPPERKLRKNNREKQRRNELNENFELLCAVLNLNSKSEKSNCLAEAISHIQALRARVEQLEALTSRAWIRILITFSFTSHLTSFAYILTLFDLT